MSNLHVEMRFTLKPLEPHSNTVSMGLRWALSWAPITPRGGIVLDSRMYKIFQYIFEDWGLGKFISYNRSCLLFYLVQSILYVIKLTYNNGC